MHLQVFKMVPPFKFLLCLMLMTALHLFHLHRNVSSGMCQVHITKMQLDSIEDEKRMNKRLIWMVCHSNCFL